MTKNSIHRHEIIPFLLAVLNSAQEHGFYLIAKEAKKRGYHGYQLDRSLESKKDIENWYNNVGRMVCLKSKVRVLFSTQEPWSARIVCEIKIGDLRKISLEKLNNEFTEFFISEVM
jgi:hypothetical protein